jgi:hypothetical protein
LGGEDGKLTWHAYLSQEQRGNQPRINARNRIGTGPWFNVKYFFYSLYPVMRNMIRRSQARPLETKPPAGTLAIGLHALIGAAFAIEERILFTGAIPGTSLLAVLSRRAG